MGAETILPKPFLVLMSEVLLQERGDRVLRLIMNRPEKRNALNQELVVALTRAFREADTDATVQAIVLAGNGRAFSAGADLASLQALQKATSADNERDSELLASLFASMFYCSKPIIARVHGHAIAGGCGLVAASDIAIGVDSVRLGFTEVRIGFVPALVAGLVIRRCAGVHARRVLLTGELLAGKDAVSLGLLTEAVAEERLDEVVDGYATVFTNETSGQAVAMTKKLIGDIATMPFSDALELSRRVNVAARESADCREGVAAFLEKRDPYWRRPQE